MDAAGWIKEAMAHYWVTGDDNFNHLMEIAQNESGFDPNAINDWDSNAMAGTPSMGLMQTIQSTFDAYAGSGKDIWNPIDNAVAAINYMIDRYGSILNTGTHGYAGGVQSAPAGLAWVGEKGPELMNFRGGESVLNAMNQLKLLVFRRLMHGVTAMQLTPDQVASAVPVVEQRYQSILVVFTLRSRREMQVQPTKSLRQLKNKCQT